MLRILKRVLPFILGAIFTITFLASFDMLSAANAERQPLMRSALKDLLSAERKLELATPDKGGHRVKALRHVRKAIKEVEKGIAFDNRY